METDIDDLRLLDDLDFLFEDGVMRLGVQSTAVDDDTFRIELFDDDTGIDDFFCSHCLKVGTFVSCLTVYDIYRAAS